MDCREITEPAVTLQVLQSPTDSRLPRLFHCIYHLFQAGFLHWILRKYSNNPNREKLWEDAKDAFQNGLIAFHRKALQKEFTLNGNLRTTIYTFGLLQLLAHFKKEEPACKFEDYSNCLELLFEDCLQAKEQHSQLNERECALLEALRSLPKKQRTILMMKFFDGMRSKQIAEMLDVSPGNVDNEVAKAYKELRRLLQSKVNAKQQTQWS